MSVPTQSWDETKPAGSRSIKLGDNDIREFKTQIREIIGVDHDLPSSGSANDIGQHLRVTLQEQADLGTGAEGTTILGNQTISGKGELVYTDEDDNDVQLTTGGKICVSSLTTVASISTILNLIYPIGFVVTLGVSTNPATLFGIGTWTAIAGKVIVGINAGDTEFDTLDETGGYKTITLTAAQSGVPAHNHQEQSLEGGTNIGYGVQGNSGSGDTVREGYVYTKNNVAADASEAHSNLQPYIVKYVWQRTA